MEENLELYESILIDGKKYTVEEKINFIENYQRMLFKNKDVDESKKKYWWQKYKILDEEGIAYWLDIKRNSDNKYKYFLHEDYGGSIEINDIINNDGFVLYEKGIALCHNFYNYFGELYRGKYDPPRFLNSYYYYTTYLSSDNKKFVTDQIWVKGEKKITIGTVLDNSRIVFENKIDKEKLAKAKKKSFLMWFIIIAILLGGMVYNLKPAVLSEIKKQKVYNSAYSSINSYIVNNTNKYTYVASVTNENRELDSIADVYKASTPDIDFVIKDIIDNSFVSIIEVNDLDISNNDDGLGLETNNGEYAYIYLEKDVVHIQISDVSYGLRLGSTYHFEHISDFIKAANSINNEQSPYYEYLLSVRKEKFN